MNISLAEGARTSGMSAQVIGHKRAAPSAGVLPTDSIGFRGAKLLSPNAPIKAPKLSDANVDRPNRGSNCVLPYTRVCDELVLEPASGPLAPGDVAWVCKTPNGIYPEGGFGPSVGTQRVSNVLGLEGLNRHLEGKDATGLKVGWNVLDLSNGAAPSAVLPDDESGRFKLALLDAYRLDGVVISNEAANSTESRDVVLNIAVQGVTPLNNGFRSYDEHVKPLSSLAYKRDLSNDYIARVNEASIERFPTQMFDRTPASLDTLFIGMRAVYLTVEEKLRVRKADKDELLFSDATAAKEACLCRYTYLPFSGRACHVIQKVIDLTAKYATEGDEAGNVLSADRAREKAVRTVTRGRYGPATGRPNDRFDDNVFDAIHTIDLQHLVGAWKVGVVMDVAAAKREVRRDTPLNSAFSVQLNTLIGWCNGLPVLDDAFVSEYSRTDTEAVPANRWNAMDAYRQGPAVLSNALRPSMRTLVGSEFGRLVFGPGAAFCSLGKSTMANVLLREAEVAGQRALAAARAREAMQAQEDAARDAGAAAVPQTMATLAGKRREEERKAREAAADAARKLAIDGVPQRTQQALQNVRDASNADAKDQAERAAQLAAGGFATVEQQQRSDELLRNRVRQADALRKEAETGPTSPPSQTGRTLPPPRADESSGPAGAAGAAAAAGAVPGGNNKSYDDIKTRAESALNRYDYTGPANPWERKQEIAASMPRIIEELGPWADGKGIAYAQQLRANLKRKLAQHAAEEARRTREEEAKKRVEVPVDAPTEARQLYERELQEHELGVSAMERVRSLVDTLDPELSSEEKRKARPYPGTLAGAAPARFATAYLEETRKALVDFDAAHGTSRAPVHTNRRMALEAQLETVRAFTDLVSLDATRSVSFEPAVERYEKAVKAEFMLIQARLVKVLTLLPPKAPIVGTVLEEVETWLSENPSPKFTKAADEAERNGKAEIARAYQVLRNNVELKLSVYAQFLKALSDALAASEALRSQIKWLSEQEKRVLSDVDASAEGYRNVLMRAKAAAADAMPHVARLQGHAHALMLAGITASGYGILGYVLPDATPVTAKPRAKTPMRVGARKVGPGSAVPIGAGVRAAQAASARRGTGAAAGAGGSGTSSASATTQIFDAVLGARRQSAQPSPPADEGGQ